VAKILSGGALMLAERWSRKVSGLAAAATSTATTATTMTTPRLMAIVLNIDPS
jgi:hypothetical protein